MTNKNCIIIHGCPSNREKAMDPQKRTYDKHWLPWLTKRLNAKGINTQMPLMPEPWEPVYEKFKAEFEKYNINENTSLIGHSCGCTFLVRWLGETKQKIDKLILVAPWKVNKGDEDYKKELYKMTIDQTIKNRVKEIFIFTANNEAKEGKSGLKMYHKALGGTIISLKGHGHFCLNDMGTDEFPELLEIVIK